MSILVTCAVLSVGEAEGQPEVSISARVDTTGGVWRETVVCYGTASCMSTRLSLGAVEDDRRLSAEGQGALGGLITGVVATALVLSFARALQYICHRRLSRYHRSYRCTSVGHQFAFGGNIVM